MYEKILADLKAQFPNRLTLTADEVARALNKSKQALASMRHRGTLPLQVMKIGNRTAVSIYQLAEFLATGNVTPPPPPPQTASSLVKKAAISKQERRRRGQNDWMIAFQTATHFQQCVLIALEKLQIEEALEPTHSQRER
jgi:hypothetical protein